MADDSRLVQATVSQPRGKQRDEPEQAHADETEPAFSGLDANDPGGITGNLRHLLPLVSLCDGQYSTTKRVRYLNDLAMVIKCVGHVIEPKYPVERVIECVRLALASGVKEVRAGALRVLRYLLTSKEAFAVMLKHRLDLFIARSLDVSPDKEIERLQAMRFVRQAISISPEAFPRSLASPLVSILLHDAGPQDNLTWSCMATLCELTLLNAELASQCGAIRALVRGLLKCSTSRISESVILTLAYLLNKPSTRKFIRSQLDIETLLAPITDLHYRHMINETDSSLYGPDNMLRVEASKMSIVSLLKSWPGIFTLCSPKNSGSSGLGSLLSMLPLAQPEVQKEILDILYSVFQIQTPVWTESFTDAVTSIDPAQPKHEWSLSEGFVVAEGFDLLPPKTVDRTDLVNCYQALLLATLLETGLFDHLVEVCLKAERHIAVMATILLAKLLHQTNMILPPGYSSDAHTLPDLIASAIDFEEAQDQRHRASEVISCLDRVHQLKKERVKPSSLYLKLILEQSGYFVAKKKSGESEQQQIPSDLDEATLLGLVKDTGVLNSMTKHYMQWDWQLLFSFFQHPSLKASLLQDDGFSKFIKRLHDFYMPSKHLFSSVVYNVANARWMSAVGQQLIKFLCRVEESSSGLLYDLVSDIVVELTQVTASKLTADVFTATNVSHKMSRDYFLFLGTVSFHRPSLLLHCKAYGPLLDICNYQNRSDLMRLIVSTMDFAHDVYSRSILNKLLTSTDKDMRLYATKHMRVLLRAKMPFFNSWGLGAIITQLYDTDRQVAMEAVDILDEGCEEENFLESLVLQQPQLLHLGEKGAALFTRFFSIKRGYTLMLRLGYLEKVLASWFKEVNLLYVYIVEERLAETLTSFKQTEEGEFIRRKYTSLIFPKAFVPVHLYGQLVQHEEGCSFLEKDNHIIKFAETIRAEINDACTPSEIQWIKASVWALGHIGSSQRGLQLLLDQGVISDLIDLAETCPVFSIRGTCFYALCLIAKTPQGANILLDANWATVRHSVEEKWPLVFDPNFDLTEDILYASTEETSQMHSLNLGPAPFMQSLFETPYSKQPLPSKNSTGNKSETLPGKVAALGRKHLNGSQGDVEFQIEESSTLLNTSRSSLKHLPLKKSSSSKSEVITSPLSGWARRDAFSNPRKRFFALSKDGSIRRNRGKFSVKSKNPLTHEGRCSKSLSSADFLDNDEKKSLPSISLRHFTHSSSGNRNLPSKPYMGVCLPMDLSQMFEYVEPDYEGCVTQIISAPNLIHIDLAPPHDPYHCLECSIPLIRPYHGIGMSISSDSLSSHFLFIQPSSSGGSTPQTPRTRAHTLGSLRLESGNSKVMSHMRSASTGLPLASAEVAAGNHMSDTDSTTSSKDIQSDSSKAVSHTSVTPATVVTDTNTPQEEFLELDMPAAKESDSPESHGDVKIVSLYEIDGGTAEEVASHNLQNDTHDNHAGEGESRSHVDSRRLNARGQSSRSPSPLLRMKRIHGSVDVEDINKETRDNEEPKASTKDDIKDMGVSNTKDMGVVNDSDVVVAKEQAQSNSIVRDPDVLIQIIKPSMSKASTHGSPTPPANEAAETASNSSSAASQPGIVDEASQEGKSRLQHAVLEVVYGLSSEVSLKKNMMGLNMIFQKFPSVCQDMCLYSQVMDLLSSYMYKLHIRRLIESKFERMTFDALFAAKPQLDEDFSEEDLLSSNNSSRRTSFSSSETFPLLTSTAMVGSEKDSDRSPYPRGFRRSSSTSDAARFREKLHSLSQSAEMHERMMVESPSENEASKGVKELHEATNSNANNNSPNVDDSFNSISNRQTNGLGSRSGSDFPVPSRSHDQIESSTSSLDSTDSGSLKSFDSGGFSVVNTGYDL